MTTRPNLSPQADSGVPARAPECGFTPGPTAAVMRAAEKICRDNWAKYGTLNATDKREIELEAAVIDRETGLPDLLEACGSAVRFILATAGEGSVCDALQAAIAKAEGR
jgi:hypothetical protein